MNPIPDKRLPRSFSLRDSTIRKLDYLVKQLRDDRLNASRSAIVENLIEAKYLKVKGDTK